MGSLILKGKRIYLQNMFEKVPVEMLQGYLNDIDQSRFMYTVPYPYTMEDARAFFNYLDFIQQGESSYELSIFSNEEDTFIGAISLGDIDKRNGTAEIGYWLRKDFWKRGYALEAAELLIDYAFNDLDLNRIYAHLQRENTASLSLLNRLGFQVEGLLRKHVINKGQYVDRYVCGLLKSEWKR